MDRYSFDVELPPLLPHAGLSRRTQHAPATPLARPATTAPQDAPRPAARPGVAYPPARPARRSAPRVRTRRVATHCDLRTGSPSVCGSACLKALRAVADAARSIYPARTKLPKPARQRPTRRPRLRRTEFLGPTGISARSVTPDSSRNGHRAGGWLLAGREPPAIARPAVEWPATLAVEWPATLFLARAVPDHAGIEQADHTHRHALRSPLAARYTEPARGRIASGR